MGRRRGPLGGGACFGARGTITESKANSTTLTLIKPPFLPSLLPAATCLNTVKWEQMSLARGEEHAGSHCETSDISDRTDSLSCELAVRPSRWPGAVRTWIAALVR